MTSLYRNMTIEEVSVLFDTGRKGNAQDAARKLGEKDLKEMDDMAGCNEDFEKGPKAGVTHIERCRGFTT
jgi:hypothetical protein